MNNTFAVSTEFRSTVCADPRGVAESLFGAELAPEVDVIVLEDTKDVRYIVLPSAAMSTADLEATSGGSPLRALASDLLVGAEKNVWQQVTKVSTISGNGAKLVETGARKGMYINADVARGVVLDVAEEVGISAGRAGMVKGLAIGVGSTVAVGAGGAGLASWLSK